MNKQLTERIVLYSVIAVLSVVLIVMAASAIIKNVNKDPGDPHDNSESAGYDDSDSGDVTTGGGTADPAGDGTGTGEPDVSSDETSGGVTTDPVTTGPAVTTPVDTTSFNVTAYDAPKTMYALFNVNARASASTGSIILFMIYQSESVTVKGETDNGWYVIEERGKTAYVRNDLLTDDPAAVEVTVTEYTSPKTMYANDDVNVREDHSTSSNIITTITKGTEVTVTGETNNGWFQVSYNGVTAYIKSEYLSVVRPTPDAGTAETTGSSSGT